MEAHPTRSCPPAHPPAHLGGRVGYEFVILLGDDDVGVGLQVELLLQRGRQGWVGGGGGGEAMGAATGRRAAAGGAGGEVQTQGGTSPRSSGRGSSTPPDARAWPCILVSPSRITEPASLAAAANALSTSPPSTRCPHPSMNEPAVHEQEVRVSVSGVCVGGGVSRGACAEALVCSPRLPPLARPASRAPHAHVAHPATHQQPTHQQPTRSPTTYPRTHHPPTCNGVLTVHQCRQVLVFHHHSLGGLGGSSLGVGGHHTDRLPHARHLVLWVRGGGGGVGSEVRSAASTPIACPAPTHSSTHTTPTHQETNTKAVPLPNTETRTTAKKSSSWMTVPMRFVPGTSLAKKTPATPGMASAGAVSAACGCVGVGGGGGRAVRGRRAVTQCGRGVCKWVGGRGATQAPAHPCACTDHPSAWAPTNLQYLGVGAGGEHELGVQRPGRQAHVVHVLSFATDLGGVGGREGAREDW